jgi:diketogulonate reductase-like aldo/keto reductase
MLKMCRHHDIVLSGYSALGASSYIEIGAAKASDSALTLPAVAKIAARHGRTPAQVLLRWGLQSGGTVVTKSTRRGRLEENVRVLDFSLADDEMGELRALARRKRFNDPAKYVGPLMSVFD